MVLQAEFKDLPFIDIPAYNISYGDSASGTIVKLLSQVPKLISAIKKENSWLDAAIRQHNIEVVISDNRYGLYNKNIPCIFITHQLGIKTSFGILADKLIQQINYRYISRFACLWIPDAKADVNLAGDLSHPAKLPPVIIKYIGPLSRFSGFGDSQVKKHLLIILSGPEPQRSILEQQLLTELETYSQPVIVLRGLPECNVIPQTKNTFVRIYNHLETDHFRQLVSDAAIIISRAGYSTIMDLLPFGKTCVFIPTPGQPEQIYLSRYLSSRNFCLSYSQKKFTLKKMFQDLQTYRQEFIQLSTETYKPLIGETFSKKN